MIVWFWANVLLTVLALAFVRFNSSAPHRLRFLVCFIAMCCWLVPWAQFGRLVPTAAVPIEFLPGPEALSVAVQTVSPAIPVSAGTALSRIGGMAATLLLVATAIGILLFAISCYRYACFLRRLSSASTSGQHLRADGDLGGGDRRRRARPEIRIQRAVPGALTTGLLVPTVWIHEDLLTSPNLKAVLIHELTHARNHDNVYLWAITFIQNVLWWNPLVLYLGYRARRLQELSCDEACGKRLQGYRDMLSRLIVNLSTLGKPRNLCVQQSSSVYGYRNFNVHRIRALERRYVMRMRHYASILLFLLLSVFVLSCVTAQDRGDAEAGARPAMPQTFTSVDEAIEALGEEGVVIPGLDPDLTMEEANEAYRSLGLYAHLLDRQYDAQELEIIRLNHELDELRNSSAEAAPPVTGPDGDYQLIERPDPLYPPRALAREFEGYVIVEYTVTATGATSDWMVVESSSSLFDRAAIDAVRRYTYRPRIENGVGVAASGVRSRVDFTIDD